MFPLISIAGSAIAAGIAAYMGVRLAVARLEVQVAHIDKIITTHDTVLDALVHRMGIVEGDLNRMKVDIGTHDTGMRGEVHEHANAITEHELRIAMLEGDRERSDR